MTTVPMKSTPSQGNATGSQGGFLSGILGNIAMPWKMALMVFILFLGMLGITIAAVLGMQRMRYNIDNIYNFMLVPIVAINDAGTGLANIQYALLELQSPNLDSTEQSTALAAIQSNDKTFSDVFTRYQTEWITTTSPDFTATLRQVRRLDLQQDEVATVKAMGDSYGAYKLASDAFTKSLLSGRLDYGEARAASTALSDLRSLNDHLIAVNNEFAKISDDAALSDYNRAFVTGGTTLVVALILGLMMSYLIVVSITSRLGELTRSASALQQGKMDQTVMATGRDEIGLLGRTFNSMAAQMKNLFGTLEQHVADRTKALSTVAEISAAASTILDIEKLLQEVVDLSKERFGLYHSHIYLTNESGDALVLAAGAGEAGRQMVAQRRAIPMDREHSLVARAARERKGVIANDVTQEPDFLPNPLLPDTHSELAVPMIAGEKVIGVFDVQSDIVNRFTDADISVQTALASQIASAVQNARLFTQAETNRQEAQSLVDYASEAITVVDLETGNFTEPNESALKLYGLSHDELVKVGPAQMSPPRQPDGRDSTEKAMEKINEAMQGKSTIFEWTHRNAQGEDILCEVRLVRLPGLHPRVRATVTDITERKQFEALTMQRSHQQEAINLITQRIQGATTIDAALQIAARELGHALGMKPTLVSLDPSALASERKPATDE